jgi:hypothetical protein
MFRVSLMSTLLALLFIMPGCDKLEQQSAIETKAPPSPITTEVPLSPTHTPAPSNPPVPAGDDIPESGYTTATISQDDLPSPTVTIVKPDSTSTTGVAYASSTTNEEGLTSFRDEILNGIVPVMVLNENGEPLNGLEIEYVSVDDHITLAVFDPTGVYAPRVVEVDHKALLASLSSHHTAFEPITQNVSFYHTYAEGDTVFDAIMMWLFDKVGGQFFKLLYVGHQMQMNPRQVVATSQGDHYLCISQAFLEAEQKASPSALILNGVVAGLDSPDLEALQLSYGVAEAVAEPSPEHPPVLVRFDWYSSHERVLYLRMWEEANNDNETYKEIRDDLSLTFGDFERVGDCVYVPDLLSPSTQLGDARAILEQLGIEWNERYVDVSGMEIHLSDADSVSANAWIVDQFPAFEYESRVAETDVRRMVPVGHVEGVDEAPFELTVKVEQLRGSSSELVPYEVTQGDCAILSWDIEVIGDGYVMVAGEKRDLADSISVCPLETTTYAIEVYNENDVLLDTSRHELVVNPVCKFLK